MRFFKWRNRKKSKSHTPISQISIADVASFPNNPPIVIDDDDNSVSLKSSVTKGNGDVSQKRKISRVSFQLGPTIVSNDLPPKSLSECGTISSAKYPRPSLKTTNHSEQLNKECPIIENFDHDSYVSYVIRVGKQILNPTFLIIMKTYLVDWRLDTSRDNTSSK